MKGNINMFASKTVILLMAHRISRFLIEEFSFLKNSCGNSYDVKLFYDNTRKDFPFHLFPEPNSYELFEVPTIQRSYDLSGCSEKAGLIPGNFVFPVLQFLHKNQQYGYAWRIEYDVRFTGDWRILFDSFNGNESDLLGTTLFRFSFRPSWVWWQTIVAPTGHLDQSDLIRGFFPIFRLSSRAAEILHWAHYEGWRGHGEGLIPTVLYKYGYSIEDIGGDGEFIRPENKHRFYTNTPANSGLWPGTFIVRASYNGNLLIPQFDNVCPIELRKLYHPVKV
jgi:hypothetical protein